ncbi:NfeD family protein [Vallitalea pronyensis]|uniref:NfeD family protein n=1 Tax=Vallitalea pronyensis TaxID=1348613 RepID=A0A8J8SFP4_9FIRM|nr:NfeD family protein [Vallitalea pronyensis]QUI21539.1 NfeD family protein [Vallitalea pronyensis]
MPIEIAEQAYVIWLGVFIVCLVIEAATLGLTTIWFAFGAFISLLLSIMGVNVPIQVFVFLIVSGGLLYFTRPIALKVLKIGHAKTNYESIIGKVGIVTQKIDNLEGKGQAKVEGQMWSCRSLTGDTIDTDMRVIVRNVKGVKLIVERVNP